MSSSYDIWLTDDAGRRILEVGRLASFFSYSRTTNGYGTVQFGMPFWEYKKVVPDLFHVDWRLDFWRSPGEGFPKRREGSFLLRKFNVYRREDGMDIIEFLGRSPLDLLRRAVVLHEAQGTKTDYADDMMKDIVRYYFINNIAWGPVPYSGGVSTGEFTCDGDISAGPTISMSFWRQNILDVLKDIKAVTFQKNFGDPDDLKIYFDVVEGPGLEGGFGYVFRTYSTLRGQDRTATGVVFSVENGNLRDPVYYEDYLDQITHPQVDGSDPSLSGSLAGNNTQLLNLSRWNDIWYLETMNSLSEQELIDRAYKIANDNKAEKSINCTFLNTPGGPTQPRSLYGVDWDLGDLVSVYFAGKNIEAEVKIIYVAVDENGQETITGRNEIGQ